MTQTTVPVIFDLDGTLVDPAQGISDGISAALADLGLGVPGKARMDAMIGPKLSIGVGWGFAPDGELDTAAVNPHPATPDPTTKAQDEVHTDGNV